jgi:hypothetical protein
LFWKEFADKKEPSQSCVAVLALVKELFMDGVTLPNYSEEFSQIIESLLNQYLQKCKDKYSGKLRTIANIHILFPSFSRFSLSSLPLQRLWHKLKRNSDWPLLNFTS